uniref:Ig-like domain-containing protein n=1 Tax=Leptobrachium leishanense TaxID=445787 RepID=A0A8C5M9M3_9ANUR
VTQTPPTVFPLMPCCGSQTYETQVTVGCLARGYFPEPVDVKWNSGSITSGIKKFPSTYKDGLFSSTSVVKIATSEWDSGKLQYVYTCKVIHDATSSHPEANIRKCTGNSLDRRPKPVYSMDIIMASKYKNRMISIYPPTPKDLHITKEGKVRCEVSHMESAEDLTITWSRSDNKKILEFTSSPEQQHDGTYTVKSDLKITPQDWNKEAEFTCKIVDPSLPTPVIKTIKKERGNNSKVEPTIYLYPPAPEELGTHDFVNILCLFKKFYPENMYVQWKKDGVLQKEDYYLNTTPVMEEEEDYFMVSKLSIAKSDWMRGATITCIAVHDQVIQKEIKKTRGK